MKARRRSRAGSDTFVGRFGLLIVGGLLVLAFSLLLPSTFPTTINLQLTLSDQSLPALLALAAMIPIVTGRFDLSIGYGLGFFSVAALSLIVDHGFSWPLASLILLAGGALVGLTNGLLVEFAQIDSFIGTLGTGSVLYALTLWITGGGRIVPGAQGLPSGFTDLANAKPLGVPIVFVYVIVAVVLLWLCLEHLPIGRYLYVVGANPRAAELVGISRRRTVVIAFVGSGVLTAFTGIIFAAQQAIGDPTAGQNYLLPAFAAALLGSTTIRPGRANAFGTLVAVAILAIGLDGLDQEGASVWAQPLFQGLSLLVAVGLAGHAARRRRAASVVVGADGRPTSEAPPDSPAADQDGPAQTGEIPLAGAQALPNPKTEGPC